MTETDHATRAQPRVALVTCADLPALDPDDQLVLPLLAGHGIKVLPAEWNDPAVDWSGFDLVVLRSPWDYAPQRDAFVTWAAGVARLANAAPVVEWNTDKRYLADLAGAGVPVVPTAWVPPAVGWEPPAAGEWVIKPAVSAGSRDTGRYRLADAGDRRLATEHVRRLQRQGRLVMVQPYLSAVDTYGETGLVFLRDPDGALGFSHAIRKGPMLTGPDVGTTGLYVTETISARSPTAAEHEVARRALAAVPDGLRRDAELLYARVDLLPGPDGSPLLVELELTEPSLFLAYGSGAADRFAAAVIAAI